MNFLKVFSLAVQVLSALPAAIAAVESVFRGIQGQGAVKKDLVLATVDTTLAVAAATGNDEAAKPEVRDQIKTLAGGAVDAIVGTFNAVKSWGKVESPDVR